MHILIHPQYMYHKITKLLIGKFVLIKPVLTCIVFRKHSYFKEINTILETVNFKIRLIFTQFYMFLWLQFNTLC